MSHTIYRIISCVFHIYYVTWINLSSQIPFSVKIKCTIIYLTISLVVNIHVIAMIFKNCYTL